MIIKGYINVISGDHPDKFKIVPLKNLPTQQAKNIIFPLLVIKFYSVLSFSSKPNKIIKHSCSI